MRNHPALGSFLKEKIAFRLRDCPIKTSVSICSIRSPSEDRAPPTQVLVKPVRLLVRSKGEGPSHPEIVSTIGRGISIGSRSEEHTSELQSLAYLVCRLLLEKKKRAYL